MDNYFLQFLWLPIRPLLLKVGHLRLASQSLLHHLVRITCWTISLITHLVGVSSRMELALVFIAMVQQVENYCCLVIAF